MLAKIARSRVMRLAEFDGVVAYVIAVANCIDNAPFCVEIQVNCHSVYFYVNFSNRDNTV